jgi:hypothetical protein
VIDPSTIVFSTPPPGVAQARLSMARLRRRLALDIDPLAPCADQTSLALAFLALEDADPAYPPLPSGIEPSLDAQRDHTWAKRLLQQAMAAAPTAAEKLRYARTIRHLAELDDSPYLTSAPPQLPHADDAS